MNTQNNTTLIDTIFNVSGATKYKLLAGENRPIDETHVKKLIESFATFGTARAIVTVIKTKAFSSKNKFEFYKADGQHTSEACNRLGLPYTVMIVSLNEDTPTNVTKYIATLNNNAKAWSNNNYLDAFAKNGLTDYIELRDILTSSKLTITDLLHIFLGKGGHAENKIFKNGEFKFTDGKGLELLQATLKVRNLIPNKSFARRSLYKVMRMANDYNRMADAIVRASDAMKISQSSFSENEKEFFQHLEKIYKAEFKATKKSAELV